MDRDRGIRRGAGPAVRGLLPVAAVVLAGCASVVGESHYFAAFRESAPGVREPVQFYRLQVESGSQMANARYLSGYFDERAVSLFFNELKGTPNARLFDDNQTLPGSGGTKLKGLSPDAGDGAFMLILSTNADDIANTIGSFAESQVVADALTRLLNRDQIKAKASSDARLAIDKAEATALVTRVEAQARQATGAATGSAAAAHYLRLLSTLAQGLGRSGPEFSTLAQAQDWFALDASRKEGNP